MTVIAPRAQLALAIGLAEVADAPAVWPGLGRVELTPFRLILVPDADALATASRDRAPRWGAGIAVPGARVIVLRADLSDLRRTLRHEVAHLALHQSIAGRVPLWFDEGYAAWAAGEWDRLEALRLNLAVASGVSPDLTELDGMLRGSANTADVAYGLAASAVLELARKHPSGRIDPLLARLREGESFSAAVGATTGLTLGQFDSAWRRSLRSRYGLVTWLLAGGFWAIVAFALAGLLWYRRRSERPRRVALDEGWVVPEDPDEPPVDPRAR